MNEKEAIDRIKELWCEHSRIANEAKMFEKEPYHSQVIRENGYTYYINKGVYLRWEVNGIDEEIIELGEKFGLNINEYQVGKVKNIHDCLVEQYETKIKKIEG